MWFGGSGLVSVERERDLQEAGANWCFSPWLLGSGLHQVQAAEAAWAEGRGLPRLLALRSACSASQSSGESLS